MNNAFLKSYQTLAEVYGKGAFSSITLNKTLTFCKSQDKALITKIVYGVLDNDIKLEYIISHYVNKMPKGDTLIFLKIGVYCLTELSIPFYAVVNDTAELSKLSGDRYVVGFVNATLKKISASVADFDDYPVDPLENLSVRCSYPLWALKKLVKDYGAQTAGQIVRSRVEHGQTVRFVNEADVDAVEKQLGCKAQITPFNDAFTVCGGALKQSGEYTAQSLSSMAVARICAQKLGGTGRFLDCCSAPGGKAVYVKQLCPEAEVTACDVHRHRTELINKYAERMGVNLFVVCKDMTVYDEKLDSAFDVVLCDVPCSGFGVLDNRPDIKLFRENKDISELMKLQYAILTNCSRYVKRGGYLVYSTCTVFDNENGQNVRKFLKEHDDFCYGTIRLAEFPDADGANFYQFLPHKDGVQGFFVAVLKRAE